MLTIVISMLYITLAISLKMAQFNLHISSTLGLGTTAVYTAATIAIIATR